MASHDAPLISVSVGLDLQDSYDQARAMEASWRAAADELRDNAVICDHPPDARSYPTPEAPAFCGTCGRAVPRWALVRDDVI